jgi:imidazolonepropionase-like amidohydrolase
MNTLIALRLTAVFCLATLFSHISDAKQVVITHATVVDVRSGKLSKNQSVFINDALISQIVENEQTVIPKDATVIDANGGFLVPGYTDMHAHLLTPDGAMPAGPLMVAYGITQYRQMNGSDMLLDKRNKHTLDLAPIYPTLLAMPGEILNGGWIHSPEQAQQAIQQQQAKGADFIKVVDMPPQAYSSALQQAQQLDIPLVGHLPEFYPVQKAAELGMDAIEHLGPRSAVLLSCSDEEITIRQFLHSVKPPAPMQPGPEIKKFIENRILNPILFSPPQEIDAMQMLLDSFNEQKCRVMARNLAQQGMWQVPTLIRLRTMELADAPEYTQHPALNSLPPHFVAKWQTLGKQFSHRITEQQKRTLADFYELQSKLVKIFDEEGIAMVAGSDVGGQWVIPGVSLHQEFELLNQAGLTPLKILQMTTLNAGRMLNKQHIGEIKPHYQASLVLLASNPLDSVTNLQDIQGVYHQGQWLDKKRLALIKGLKE